MVVLASSTPASAHGTTPGDPKASNWENQLTSSASPAPGVTVTLGDGGIVELINESRQVGTVTGYDDEPYLKVGPDGLYENRRSPATYINTTNNGSTPIPATADSKAEPDWIQVSAAHRVTWHDHRTHWMAGPPPVQALRGPGSRHVVIPRWSIPLVIDGGAAEVTGRLTWVTPPPIWLWIVAIIVLAGLVLLASSISTSFGVRIGGAILLLAAVADAVGSSLPLPDPPSATALALVLPVCLLVVGLCLPAAHARHTAAVATGAIGAALVLAFAHWGFLTSSQVPSALPTTIARLCVCVAVGAGLGLGACAVVSSRRPAMADRLGSARA